VTGLYTVPPSLLIGLGGAVGAVLRHVVGVALDSERFPYSTLTVNVVGSGVLAAVIAVGFNRPLVLLVGTGACGAFTTFSSFAFETVRMWETGARGRAALNAAANLALALAVVVALTAAL
jgi:CrcB protein